MKKPVRKYLAMAVTAMALTTPLQGQDIAMMNLQYALGQKAATMTNGFSVKTEGTDITYGNLWNKFDQAFLTRATNGEMGIEWQSDAVKIAGDGKAHLLHLVCVDQATESYDFRLFVAGTPVGTIVNFKGASYHKELEKGVCIDFVRVGQTEGGDATCFMEITVPQELAPAGRPVLLKLVGTKAQSNSWIMVFKTPGLLDEMDQRNRMDRCLHLWQEKDRLTCQAPVAYQGRQVEVSMNGGKPVTARFQAADQCAVLTCPAPVGLKALKLSDKSGTLYESADFSAAKDTVFLDGYTLKKQTVTGDGRRIWQETYSPSQDYLQQLASSWWKNAQFHVLVSSHQDIAWMDTPFRCVEKRDEVILTPALDLLGKHPDYCYDIEDALMVEEYLQRNPRKRSEMQQYLLEGRLGIGCSYTQPYEEMQTSEALARQFYFGKRFLMKTFQGYTPKTYWNEDVPGRTLQMPQILQKSGVEMLQYSRHGRGMFRWMSPDSSSVTVFTPGHYGIASLFLRKSPEEGLPKFTEYCEGLQDYRQDKHRPAVLPLLSAEDMAPAHTYYHWIDKMKQYAQSMQTQLPEFRHSTSDRFLAALKASDVQLPTITGERPDIWMYIHGAGHERALTTYREANRKATFAETFQTVACLLDGSFRNYPQRELNDVWQNIIYPDHGWGGNGGHVTDSVFHACYQHADEVAGGLCREAAEGISHHIRLSAKKGVPVVVFNALSTVYDSPVSIVVDRSDAADGSLCVTDAQGRVLPSQASPSGDGKTTIEFIARSLPSVGYTTYYLTHRKGKAAPAARPASSDYYDLHFDEAGRLVQITDKELHTDLFDTSKFEVGEVITLQSVGNGAGEFNSIQPVSMEGYDQTSRHGASWQLVESGPVFSLYRSEAKFQDATVVRYLKLYTSIKRIDFPTSILGFNGRNYREFRQVFPLKSKGEIRYEVPFGTVTVGKDELKEPAGERYMDDPKTIHPRSIANWIASNDGQTEVKLTSSVVMADYVDPTDRPSGNTVLQPILFASRRSCHWQGEFYSQHGDHHFHFTLSSSAPGSVQSDLVATASNTRPVAVVNPQCYTTATLPESLSFFQIDDERCSISAVKKHEDKDEVVLRFYDAVHDGAAHPVRISSYFPVGTVKRTDMIEMQEGETLPEATLTVGNRSIETVALEVQGLTTE